MQLLSQVNRLFHCESYREQVVLLNQLTVICTAGILESWSGEAAPWTLFLFLYVSEEYNSH